MSHPLGDSGKDELQEEEIQPHEMPAGVWKDEGRGGVSVGSRNMATVGDFCQIQWKQRDKKRNGIDPRVNEF